MAKNSSLSWKGTNLKRGKVSTKKVKISLKKETKN